MKPFCRCISNDVLRNASIDQCLGHGAGASGRALARRQWHPGAGNVSLGSLVGFVTVLGIAVRNGSMMVSHFRHLEQQEGMRFGDELTLRGAQERLAPVLMTALTAALALIPLVVAGNRPGHEIEYPMALVSSAA